MKYMFLLYNVESEEHLSPEAMAEWAQFEKYLGQRGGKIAGAALQSTATATTVSSRRGETIVSDGPFADTKEQLGGFYIVECADLDEAVEVAARIPWASSGHIEVRPVMDFG
ncbi:MAG: YciI family protein [Thermomicrobiales bacterium]